MKRAIAAIQGIIVAAALIGGAAALGLAVRVFLWTSGLGG